MWQYGNVYPLISAYISLRIQLHLHYVAKGGDSKGGGGFIFSTP